MKKTNIAFAFTMVIVLLLGALYIGKSAADREKGQAGGYKDDGKETVSSQGGNKTFFGEYKYELSGKEKIIVNYMKSGQGIKIFSISPVADKKKYDISQGGSAAAYKTDDGAIWLLFNDGTFKKILADSYGRIKLSDVRKKYPSYIWAESPEFISEDRLSFISDLPDTSANPKKSLWEASLQNDSIKKVYTPNSASFRYLGIRDDGKMLVLDGEQIAAVDTDSVSVENVDVSQKHIISFSDGGNKILFAKMFQDKPDFGSLYVMNGYGKNITKLPDIKNYTATDMGAWNGDGLKYALVARQSGGINAEIVVISFDDDSDDVDMNGYSLKERSALPDKSQIEWLNDETISIDTGSDVFTVDLQ